MPTVHFLNVSPGDCSIIQHVSGRVSMIDICDGNLPEDENTAAARTLLKAAFGKGGDGSGNFRMADYPTNPIPYARGLGINRIWRFILSHPDMDHMDGLDALCTSIGINNFWDTGVTRDRPPFGGTAYKEEDWDRYELLRTGSDPGVISLVARAGAEFKYANTGEDSTPGGDGLFILSPDAHLVAAASAGDDINDGSYVILYKSHGNRVIFSGDAHDATWEYVLRNHLPDVERCSVLIAPHHGRSSGRSYDFLDQIKPRFTLFGNAPSEHMAYAAWNYRNFDFITSNQAGNVVLEISQGGIDVYVENDRFAAARGRNTTTTNGQGYVFLGSILQNAGASAA